MPRDRPIPAFYCCYLLRSTVRHSGVYVGSTPNPVRRLDQHNGVTKGGAVRTSRHSLRPWEMTCIVTGFPSHIAALQFEWAWQNPHITLHIPPSARIQHATQKKRSGQPKRPRQSIQSLLSSLHLLLRVPSFSRWPLDVRFFNEDIHKAWLRWTKAVAEPLRDSIPIITDFASPPAVQDLEDGKNDEGDAEADRASGRKKRKLDHGIGDLAVDFAPEKSRVEKARDIVGFEREGACAVCKKELEHDAGIYTICPSPSCESVTHITCLSTHFLATEPDADALVPTKGKCPSCNTELRWVHVVKELSLRMRGQKEVEKLLKVKRVKNEKGKGKGAVIEDSDAEDDDEIEADIFEELQRLHKLDKSGNKTNMGDRWNEPEDSQDSDTGSVTSAASAASLPKKAKGASKKEVLPTVIEDSDWDDASVVD